MAYNEPPYGNTFIDLDAGLRPDPVPYVPEPARGITPYEVNIKLSADGSLKVTINGTEVSLDSITIRCGLSGFQILDAANVPVARQKVLQGLASAHTDAEPTEPFSEQPAFRGGNGQYL